jgi:hypothetical protein
MTKQIFKRLMTLSILAIATIFSLSFQAKAAELLSNGGFETTLIGWTTTNTALPATQRVFCFGAGHGGYDEYAITQPYFHPSFPQEGSRSCFMALDTVASAATNTVRLYQDVTVPSGTTLTISWKQRFSQKNLGNATTDNIRLRVYIRRPSDDAILQTLNAKDLLAQQNEVFPWETQSINLGTTYAGQSIRIEFNARISDDTPSFNTTRGLWELDAVSANALPPTAAAVSVSGRVLNAEGRPIIGAVVRIMDINGGVQSTRTNQFGQYRFSVEAGNVYAMETRAKGLRFIDNPRIITVQDEVAEEDFRADGASIQKIE